jgi:hypothetical protein
VNKISFEISPSSKQEPSTSGNVTTESNVKRFATINAANFKERKNQHSFLRGR